MMSSLSIATEKNNFMKKQSKKTVASNPKAKKIKPVIHDASKCDCRNCAAMQEIALNRHKEHINNHPGSRELVGHEITLSNGNTVSCFIHPDQGGASIIRYENSCNVNVISISEEAARATVRLIISRYGVSEK